MKSVRIETAADRAVIGAMQALQAGDSFVVLVSQEIEAQRVTGWLTQGARWRGSLEAQDEDVFHHLAESCDPTRRDRAVLIRPEL